jgi:hypothetical protein
LIRDINSKSSIKNTLGRLSVGPAEVILSLATVFFWGGGGAQNGIAKLEVTRYMSPNAQTLGLSHSVGEVSSFQQSTHNFITEMAFIQQQQPNLFLSKASRGRLGMKPI